MIKSMLTLLPDSPPVIVPEWNKLITDTTTKFKVYKDRQQLSSLVSSKGVRLLRNLLFDIDSVYLLTHPNDFDRYTNYINNVIDELKNRFDPVYKQTSGVTNTFVSGNDTPEFILGVDITTPLMTLPMEQGWDSWKDLKPVRLWYHTSTELIDNITPGKMVFKQMYPTYSVSTIDLTLLIFKYIKYIELVGLENYSIDTFIHQHVLNGFLDDIMQTWFLNIFKTMVNSESVLEVIVDQMSTMFVPISLSDAISKGMLTLDKFRGNKITLASLLSSHWLNTGSILDWMRTTNRALKLPAMRQYLHLEWLKILPSVEVVTTLNNQRSPTGESKRLNKDIKDKLREYKRSNLFNAISENNLKQHLTDSLETIEESIQ